MSRLKLTTVTQLPIAITEAEMLSQLPGLGYCEPEAVDLDKAWQRLVQERQGTAESQS